MIRGMLLSIALLATSLASASYPFEACFDVASRRHQVDLELLLAVAAVESNWNPDARSPMNAHGVMQIRWPATARHLGVRRVAELYNPCLNIDLGARYLREMLDRYDGDVVLALAAYNFGPTRLRSRRDIPDSVLGYVDRVMDNRARIASTFAGSATPLPTGRLELVRFDRPSRAAAFAEGLRRQMPGADVTVASEHETHAVYVDSTSLGDADRRRLQRLFPAGFR